MADNVPITAGAGTAIAADDVGSVFYQRVKVALGPDGTYTADADGTAARGQYVDPRLKVVRLQVTPTISTSIYAAKEAIGGLYTFAGAVRSSGGSGRIVAIQIHDKDQEKAGVDLVFFDRTFTAPTDNAVFDPTDAELATVVGVVSVVAGHYADFNDNSVAHVAVDLPFVLNGTDLFAGVVARGTPTYGTTSDITISLTIEQD